MRFSSGGGGISSPLQWIWMTEMTNQQQKTTHLIKDVYYVQKNCTESWIICSQPIWHHFHSMWILQLLKFKLFIWNFCQKFIKYSRVIWNMLFNLNKSKCCSWAALINCFSCHFLERITNKQTNTLPKIYILSRLWIGFGRRNTRRRLLCRFEWRSRQPCTVGVHLKTQI